MKKSFKNRYLALILLLYTGLVSAQSSDGSALRVSALDSAEQLSALQQQVEDLEYEFGPYHASLLEPLESMVDILRESGDYEQMATLQSRQLQVMRTELGLEHPDLIPLLESILATDLASGDWEAIEDQLEHIRYLRSTVEGDNTEVLLSAIQDQIDWLYSRITVEDRREQAGKFFKIRDLHEEIEDLVEDAYGEDSLEAAPWLYKVAYTEYQLVRFLNASRGLGSESIDRLVQREGTFRLERQNRSGLSSGSFFGGSSITPVIDRGRPIGDDYLRAAYSIVNKLEKVVEENADLEAQAMIKIYRSDFQLLSDRGRGIRGYRDAQRMLLEAGKNEGDVRWFFERPMLIPAPSLHLNFADALSAVKESLEPLEIEDDVIHLGEFTAWAEALDSTPMPSKEHRLWKFDYPFQYADVSFSVSSRGKASSVDILATGPDETEVDRSVWRSVRNIHFRPAIIDEKARRVRDVRLRYTYIDE